MRGLQIRQNRVLRFKNKEMKSQTILLLLLNFLLSCVNSKKIYCKPDLFHKNKNQWAFCTKMAFGHGQIAKVKASAMFNVPNVDNLRKNVQILIFQEKQWDTILQAEDSAGNIDLDCRFMAKHARYKDYLYFKKDEPYSIEFERLTGIGDEIWYFVISDCTSLTQEPDTRMQIPFTVTLDILNGDSHFSEEDNGTMQYWALALVVVMTFMVYNVYLGTRDMQKFERLDDPLLVTTVALMLLVLKSVAQLVYLIIYSTNGRGFVFLRIYSTFCSLASQFLVSALFLALSFGWGTIKKQVNLADVYEQRFILGGAFIAHAAIAVLMFFDHEEHHKFHDYQGSQGLAICLIRVLFFIAFVWGLSRTLCEVKQGISAQMMEQERQLRFLAILGVLGSLFFLALPISVMFAQYTFPPFQQQGFIIISIYCSQVIAILALIYQFSKKNSAFFRLSYKKEGLRQTADVKIS